MRRSFIKRLDAEGVLSRLAEIIEVEEQDGKQHQNGTEQCVQEEFDGRVKFARAAPDADQQVHGHEHSFPENEEQEKVEGHEHAEHSALQHQKPDVVFLDPGLDRAPRGEDRDPSQQSGEHDQQKRDAVDAEHVAGADGGDPVIGRALHELETGFVALGPEPWHQRDGDDEAGQGNDVRNPANGVFLLFGNKEEQKSADERRE